MGLTRKVSRLGCSWSLQGGLFPAFSSFLGINLGAGLPAYFIFLWSHRAHLGSLSHGGGHTWAAWVTQGTPGQPGSRGAHLHSLGTLPNSRDHVNLLSLDIEGSRPTVQGPRGDICGLRNTLCQPEWFRAAGALRGSCFLFLSGL